jgi:uncharacterized protein YbaP (TraB family)
MSVFGHLGLENALELIFTQVICKLQKHFETQPHICVKISTPAWLSLFSHQVHKARKRKTEPSHLLGTMHGFSSGLSSGL